jgi:hypothetical protein
MFLAPRNRIEIIAPRSTFGSGNDSQQWMNYLEKYTQPVEELMKLTRNKRHFYQRDLRAETLIRQGS